MRFARLTVLAILALGFFAAPLAAEAQVSGRLPPVGYLGYERSTTDLFEQALKDLGWEDGRNVVLEWRFPQGEPARLPTLAAELVRLNLDVIVAADETRVNALREITSTILIVFFVTGDPVAVLTNPPGGASSSSNGRAWSSSPLATDGRPSTPSRHSPLTAMA